MKEKTRARGAYQSHLIRSRTSSFVQEYYDSLHMSMTSMIDSWILNNDSSTLKRQDDRI